MLKLYHTSGRHIENILHNSSRQSAIGVTWYRFEGGLQIEYWFCRWALVYYAGVDEGIAERNFGGDGKARDDPSKLDIFQ